MINEDRDVVATVYTRNGGVAAKQKMPQLVDTGAGGGCTGRLDRAPDGHITRTRFFFFCC